MKETGSSVDSETVLSKRVWAEAGSRVAVTGHGDKLSPKKFKMNVIAFISKLIQRILRLH